MTTAAEARRERVELLGDQAWKLLAGAVQEFGSPIVSALLAACLNAMRAAALRQRPDRAARIEQAFRVARDATGNLIAAALPDSGGQA